MTHKLYLRLFDAESSADNAQGVTDSPTDVSENGQTSPDTESGSEQETYADVISRYKAEYDADVQGKIRDRLKNSNKQIADYKSREKAIAPILEHLGKKYNVNPSDVDAILNAFHNDDKLLEDEAYKRNLTVEQLRYEMNLERENAALKAEQEENARQAQFAEWDRQSEQMKNIYPTFDVNAEMKNPDFIRMMDAGVPIRTAYEVAHKDEIMAGAMQYTANMAAEKVTNAVKANKSRPVENGLSGTSASVTRTDISSLTIEQMQQYIDRAKAGERIDFRH